jgi:hypothetical protein
LCGILWALSVCLHYVILNLLLCQTGQNQNMWGRQGELCVEHR